MRRLHGSLSGCRGLQAVSHQDVVGEGEPAQGGVDLGQAAHGEPGEAPLPKARIDAFAHGATLVDGLAVRALHAPAPGGDTRAVLGAGRIGVGSMLAVARWAVDPDAALGRPLGIGVLMNAAVYKMPFWPAAMALLQPHRHRAHQAAVAPAAPKK